MRLSLVAMAEQAHREAHRCFPWCAYAKRAGGEVGRDEKQYRLRLQSVAVE